MTDPFAAALSAYYLAGANLGDPQFKTATFTPATGATVSCAIRLYQEDNLEPDGFTARVNGVLTLIEYQRTQLARDAVKGETFTVGSTVYTVQAIKDRDSISIRVVVI